jgi:hypothetical protein
MCYDQKRDEQAGIKPSARGRAKSPPLPPAGCATHTQAHLEELLHGQAQLLSSRHQQWPPQHFFHWHLLLHPPSDLNALGNPHPPQLRVQLQQQRQLPINLATGQLLHGHVHA